MKKAKQLISIILLFLIFPNITYSQETDKQNLGTWITYRNRLKINSKFYYLDDFSYRYTIFDDNWQRLTFNPLIVFNATNSLEIYFGVGNHLVIQDQISDSYELRIWQAAKISWPNIKRFNFDHFLRMEERNIYSIENHTWDTGYRARYRLNMVVPINNIAIAENTFYIGANAEAYANIGRSLLEKYIDQARFSATFGYRKNLKWAFELMYVVDDSKELKENNFELNNHMIRFRIINLIAL